MNIFKAVKLVPAHFLIMNLFLLLLTSRLLYSMALEFGNLIILCFLMKSFVRKSVRLSILFLFEHTCPSVVDFWESLKQDLRQIQLNFLVLSPMIARMIECY